MGSGGSSQALHGSIFSMPQCLVSHLLHVVLVVACPRAAYLCWCSRTGAVHKFDLHGEQPNVLCQQILLRCMVSCGLAE